MNNIKRKGPPCRHDYKNAVAVGKIDHVCPLCNKLLNPNKWFLITHFESLGVKFVENQ